MAESGIPTRERRLGCPGTGNRSSSGAPVLPRSPRILLVPRTVSRVFGSIERSRASTTQAFPDSHLEVRQLRPTIASFKRNAVVAVLQSRWVARHLFVDRRLRTIHMLRDLRPQPLVLRA